MAQFPAKKTAGDLDGLSWPFASSNLSNRKPRRRLALPGAGGIESLRERTCQIPMDFQPIIAAVFAAYFLTLIAIALFRANRMREMSDYVLAGRRMSSFTSALSASSSTTSGWTMLVFPALAFSEGAVHLWTTASLVLGAWFTWTILGKRLRRYTILEESLTLPDFFEKRFADRTGMLRTVSAALTIFFIMF